MTQKQFAAKVASRVGFDPATIITLLTLLLPLIQQLPCFKKSAAKLKAGIDEEYRETLKRKGPPPRIAQALKKEGYVTKEARREVWEAMCCEAFANRDAVAAALAA